MSDNDVAPSLSDLDSSNPGPGMGKCDITGKIVPEDELVVIQGKRVCAEGKAELLQRLQSGEKMPGELERPTVLRRFGCIFVDGIILAILGVVMGGIVGGAAAASGAVGAPTTLIAGIQLVVVAIGITYFAVMHGTKGQTLGKMAGKLKVVNADGSDIDMKTAFVRSIFYQGPQVLAPIVMILGVGLSGINAVSSIAGLYALVTIILALIDKAEQKPIHDRVAGTRVVVVG